MVGWDHCRDAAMGSQQTGHCPDDKVSQLVIAAGISAVVEKAVAHGGPDRTVVDTGSILRNYTTAPACLRPSKNVDLNQRLGHFG